MKKEIVNLKNTKISEIELNEKLTSDTIQTGSLYYKWLNENANIHPGNAFKKSRALVRGGGRKPYQQKHTGRARQGSIRAPHYKGGGRAWGNQYKNYKFNLPTALKRNALISIFNIKFKQNLITLIENFNIKTPSVNEFLELFKNLVDVQKEKIILIILEGDKNLSMAIRNLNAITLMSIKRMKIIPLLNKNKIFMTKDAVEYLNTL